MRGGDCTNAFLIRVVKALFGVAFGILSPTSGISRLRFLISLYDLSHETLANKNLTAHIPLEIERFSLMDVNKDGSVQYEEFIAAWSAL